MSSTRNVDKEHQNYYTIIQTSKKHYNYREWKNKYKKGIAQIKLGSSRIPIS